MGTGNMIYDNSATIRNECLYNLETVGYNKINSEVHGWIEFAVYNIVI